MKKRIIILLILIPLFSIAQNVGDAESKKSLQTENVINELNLKQLNQAHEFSDVKSLVNQIGENEQHERRLIEEKTQNRIDKFEDCMTSAKSVLLKG
jgi:hypothetical protein